MANQGIMGCMAQTRVFHIANEFRTDITTVTHFLSRLGVEALQPESSVEDDDAETAREMLRIHFKSRDERESARKAQQEAEAVQEVEAKKLRECEAREAERQRRLHELRGSIPRVHALLLDLVDGLDLNKVPKVLVVYYDSYSTPRYGICDVEGEKWEVPSDRAGQLKKVFGVLRKFDEEDVAQGRAKTSTKKRSTRPYLRIKSQWYAFSMSEATAWHADSLSEVKNPTEYLDARTLHNVPKPAGPPRLAEKAQLISPEKALVLKALLSNGLDRPEETFLIDESLLRLAVDSLDGAKIIAPMPVHVNAIWVFSRPVVMGRPDGTERHAGVLWFQEGAVLWRMRVFTAGGTNDEPNAKQLGEQLVERKPFVPVWDRTRPEQKLIAAIWALMSQGDVTENERADPDWRGAGRPLNDGHYGRGVTVVRVKAGTEHAAVYGQVVDQGGSMRGTWSVRGHWRQQPYPSLGVDEEGHVITKPVWIASYTKGVGDEEPGEKVIVIRA